MRSSMRTGSSMDSAVNALNRDQGAGQAPGRKGFMNRTPSMSRPSWKSSV